MKVFKNERWTILLRFTYYILAQWSMFNAHLPYQKIVVEKKNVWQKKMLHLLEIPKRKLITFPAPPLARTINHQRHSHVHNTSTQPSSQMIERKSSIRISVVSHQLNRSNWAAKVCKHSNFLSRDGSEWSLNSHWEGKKKGIIKLKWQFMLIGY